MKYSIKEILNNVQVYALKKILRGEDTSINMFNIIYMKPYGFLEQENYVKLLLLTHKLKYCLLIEENT